ncbi:MAG: T9SS type A sorting domain-containing protein, partial [Ferruginibacter sp.]
AENLNVRFNSSENGEAEIRITNTSGQKIISKHSTVNKGNSNMQVNGLGMIPKGLYIAQLIVNGIVVDNQKVIRN